MAVAAKANRRSMMMNSFVVVQILLFVVIIIILTTTTEAAVSAANIEETESSSSVTSSKKIRKFRFALCPKSIDNPFFDVSRDGCYDRAKQLTTTTQEIECLYVGPRIFNPDGIEQANIIRELIYNHTNENQYRIDGLAISITNPNEMRPVIKEALEKQIPVVTFDSDDKMSGRSSYIGTDNYFFGKQLGKVLQQLQPEAGGTFAIITDTTPNIIERERGVRNSLLGRDDKETDTTETDDEKEDSSDSSLLWWAESSSSPVDMKGNNTLAIELIDQLLSEDKPITAVVPVMGGPMFLPDLWTNLVDKYPDVTFVVGDGLQVQLEFLSRGKVSGLVAQLPYSMGTISIDSLLKLATSSEEKETTSKNILPDFQGTNLLEHLQIPLVLPPLTVNQNHLGNLSMLGFTLFGIIVISAYISMTWTIMNQHRRVVKLAQPGFLIQIAVGTIIMGAAIVPLSFDDSSPNYTDRKGQVMCMAVPWLAFLGFTIVYSALVAKLWRVNQIYQSGTYHNVVVVSPTSTRSRHSRSSRNSSPLYNGGGGGGGGGTTTTSSGTPPSSGFQRVKLRFRDVLIPLGLLLTANVVTLLTWSLIDPLQYTRVNAEGTDPWNRVMATYGTCTMDQPWPYLAVLGLLNVGVLIFATIQAYKARDIKVSEIADESKYVAMAVASMLHVSLVGMPLLAVVRDDPQAWYLTLVFLLFVVCMVVLLVVFVPKMMYTTTKKATTTPRNNRIPASVVQSPPTPRQTGAQQHQESSLLSSVSEEDEMVHTSSSLSKNCQHNKQNAQGKGTCSQPNNISSRGIFYSVTLESIPEELCPSSTAWSPRRIQVSSLGSTSCDFERPSQSSNIMLGHNPENVPPSVPTRKKTWLDENGEVHMSSEFHAVDDNNNQSGDSDYYGANTSPSNGGPMRREQSAMESSSDGSRDMIPLKPLPKSSFSILSEESSDHFATFNVEEQEATDTGAAAATADAGTAVPTSASIAADHMAAW